MTDAVLDDLRAWLSRQLDPLHAIVGFDRIVVNGRQNSGVSNNAMNLALGITMQVQKKLLGLLFLQNEEAKFCLAVMTELKNFGAFRTS